MPAIAWKEMTLPIAFAQGRRIRCQHCDQTFHYLACGVKLINVAGLPLLSSDKAMREALVDKAVSTVKIMAKGRRLGEAACPHCGRFQNWMVRRVKLLRAGVAALIGSFVGAFGGCMVWMSGRSLDTGIAMLQMTVGATLGAFVAACVGWLLPARRRQERGADAQSATDEAFGRRLLEWDRAGADPWLSWFVSAGGGCPREGVIVSLGLVDTTGGPVPDKYSVDAALKVMEADDVVTTDASKSRIGLIGIGPVLALMLIAA